MAYAATPPSPWCHPRPGRRPAPDQLRPTGTARTRTGDRACPGWPGTPYRMG